MNSLCDTESIRLKPENWAAPLDLKKSFNRTGPFNLEVDLGCGKGRFLIARAMAHRQVCFLGIDRRRQRIEKVERKALRLNLENVRLLQAEASFAVESLLPSESVSVYYLFFSDPWPKRRHHRRRLFNPDFLNALWRTLLGKGCIHVATDHLDYFAIIRDTFRKDQRFSEIEPFVPAKEEQTDFEVVFLAQMKPIGRCSFMKKNP